MTVEGFWAVWVAAMLWTSAVLCGIYGVFGMFQAEERRHGLPTLFITVSVLCLLQLGVIPQ